MHYELRLYEVVQGRVGDMHARMRDHFATLFAKHGVNVAGRWPASRRAPQLTSVISVLPPP